MDICGVAVHVVNKAWLHSVSLADSRSIAVGTIGATLYTRGRMIYESTKVNKYALAIKVRTT